jgi:class 3 adenylate cyclase
MSTFKTNEADFTTAEVDGKNRKLLLAKKYDSFDTSLLNLGDITQPSLTTDAIAAVFDLEGFTNFCKQLEPHLSVPLFLNQFLNWLLSQIKEEMTVKKADEGVLMYCPLPFFVKFMGDGLLVLWDASTMSDIARMNVTASMCQICRNYEAKFFTTVAKRVVDPPPVLRCGLARGNVYSVGNGNDFVGSSINMAARLQKLPGASFSFNIRGFHLNENKSDFVKKYIVVKRIAVRGIGDNELVALLSKEFDVMKAKEKSQFRDP